MGTDLVTNYTVLQAAISLHSAHVGTDTARARAAVQIEIFQSTVPMWALTFGRHPVGVGRDISIHQQNNIVLH